VPSLRGRKIYPPEEGGRLPETGLSAEDTDTSEHTDPRLTERMMDDDMTGMWQNIPLFIWKKSESILYIFLCLDLEQRTIDCSLHTEIMNT